MAFSRKQMVAAVAGTLSLAVLTGCPAATNPAATTPTPTPTPVASTPASTTPVASTPASTTPVASTPASTAPTGSASPGASTAPSASAPVPSGKLVIVSGNIYDEEGATVDDALITVKSLDASVPYTATATTNGGSWVVNNVPEGANVEIIATRDGWTTRRRVGSFQQQATGKKNVINFGAAGGDANNDDEDPTGEAYFISDYPEITMTSPGDESTGNDPTKFVYKISFSEPLTEDSRDAFEDAFVLVPTNDEAVPNNTPNASYTDLKEGEDDDVVDGIASSTLINNVTRAYTLGENDAFLGSSRNKLTASWNSQGTEATFTFNGGNLLTGDNDTADYVVALISQGGDDEIEDEDGNQLGTNGAGDLDTESAENLLIYNAFKETDLSIDENLAVNDTGDRNWASTHDSVAELSMREDETDPKLTAIAVTEEGDDQRIELTFSEPMAAYGIAVGATANNQELGVVSNEIYALENYSFAVGEDRGDISDVDLEGDVGLDQARPDLGATFGATASAVDDEEEFQFGVPVTHFATEIDIDSVTAAGSAGTVVIDVDEDNPTTVFLWIANRNDWFVDMEEIKARVEDVADPASNAITENDADANVVTGNI